MATRVTREPRPNRAREFSVVVVNRYTGLAREIRVEALDLAEARSRVTLLLMDQKESIDSIRE